MSTEQTPKKSIYSNSGAVNALDFVIQKALADIATAIPVKVVAVQGGRGSAGYVDVLPLVSFVAGDGKAVEPVTLYHLPYSRIQGGIASLIIDPVVGDIGLAIFAQSDSSGVIAGSTEPQPPVSNRKHSQSDGFYIGGFLNQAPTCYLELTQGNTAELRAVGGIHVIGNTVIDGNVTINGNLSINGQSTMQGGLSASQDITSGSISVQNHVHGGVQSGGSNTSAPR